MKNVLNSKKTLVLAAVVSIMSLSVASSTQTNALTLSEFLSGLTSNNQSRDNQTGNQARPTNNTNNTTPNRQQNIVEQILPTTQQPTQTTPATPTEPAQTQVQQTQTAAPQQAAPARTVAPTTTKSPTVTPIDTSAAVVSTANSQTTEKSAANATPYTSNKIDPMLAQKLLFAGIATITAGTLIYAASIFPFGKKQVRHIPVKSL